MKERKKDPVLTGIGITLKTGTVVAALIAALSASSVGVTCAGLAVLGTAVGLWIYKHKKQMNQAIQDNGLTPTNDPIACGIKAKEEHIINQEERD